MTVTTNLKRSFQNLYVTSNKRCWFYFFAAAAVVFATTTHMGHIRVNDTDAANVPAWWFVRHGTFYLDALLADTHSNNPWFIHVNGHVVSNRTPGVVLFGLPLQAIFARLNVSQTAVGSFTAVLATAASVANVSLLARRMNRSSPTLFFTAVFALGTGVWTVASAELWPHTADLLWISCGLLALQNNRTLLAGIAMAPLVTTRPHLAVAIAVMGVWLGVSRRSWHVIGHFALPAGLATGVLVLWNTWLFGRVGISGGYSGMVDELPGHGSILVRMIINAAGMLGSPLRGVLLYSPIVIIWCICIFVGWHRSPDWAKATFAAGLCYEVVQLRLNRYSGGYGFYSSRLVLEFVILSVPLTLIGLDRWGITESPAKSALTRALASASIGIHAIGAFCSTSYLLHPRQSWTDWGPLTAIKYQPERAAIIIVLTLMIGSILTVWPLRRVTLVQRVAPELAISEPI